MVSVFRCIHRGVWKWDRCMNSNEPVYEPDSLCRDRWMNRCMTLRTCVWKQQNSAKRHTVKTCFSKHVSKLLLINVLNSLFWGTCWRKPGRCMNRCMTFSLSLSYTGYRCTPVYQWSHFHTPVYYTGKLKRLWSCIDAYTYYFSTWSHAMNLPKMLQKSLF